MKKVETTAAWRTGHADSTFELKFKENVDMNKVMEAIKEAVRKCNITDGYADLWIQDIEENHTKKKIDVLSALCSWEFPEYIPAMVEAIARALPTASFEGNANRDDLKCFWILDYEFSYDGKDLRIKETFMDDDYGYFCPECGYQVAFPYEEFEEDEVICEDCEETIKVSELRYVPADVTEKVIAIR